MVNELRTRVYLRPICLFHSPHARLSGLTHLIRLSCVVRNGDEGWKCIIRGIVEGYGRCIEQGMAEGVPEASL